ncbi:MAG: DUF1858 domain-containing protein [Candidatus Dojkabacteria bacterium]|nr:DUF1858 domain-containing protein [Candidatus Dojkabacteria bacterium]
MRQKKISKNKKSKRIKLDINMSLSELITKYPELKNVLLEDYGLHCVNCIISDYDTLLEGARLHGIEGKYFDEMIANLEKIINDNR